ncbi:hypothetical protein DPMN_046589 [Dreissena polymorpha]|uniref:Uncharacterized protein n=1 Tax=Dreissena polymorpha TaxID=45954 RepID=A0A9D4I0N9_DREPO|nr:hypothetical protein DPMN_046589 [Dreissena polymorpha]
MNESRAWRKQYPLKLAFGLTIHKAQGMTLDRYSNRPTMSGKFHIVDALPEASTSDK